MQNQYNIAINRQKATAVDFGALMNAHRDFLIWWGLDHHILRLFLMKFNLLLIFIEELLRKSSGLCTMSYAVGTEIKQTLDPHHLYKTVGNAAGENG